MESQSELKYIFAHINDLLKFAETKNAGLSIVNAGLIIGVMTVPHFITGWVIWVGVGFFGFSIVLNIITQLPKTDNNFFNRNDFLIEKEETLNLYFFGHLAKLSDKQFIDEYKKTDTEFTPSEFDKALIHRILFHSRIVHGKFFFFKISAFCTALGIVEVLILSVVV